MATPLKCNQCKAVDLKKINETTYQCTYCDSKIIVEKTTFNFNDFLKDTLKDGNFKKYAYTYTTSNTDTKTTTVHKPLSRTGCFIIVAVFIGIALSVIIPITLLFTTSKSIVNINEVWQNAYSPTVFFTYGSKGPAVWELQTQQLNWKNYKLTLNIIDPRTHKTLKSIEMVKPQTETINTNDLFNGGKVFGDTIFFSPEQTLFEARNIYTGDVVMQKQDLEKKASIVVASTRTYNTSTDEYITIKSALDDDYYYFQKQNKIIKAADYRKSDVKTQKYFFVFVGNGEKKAVWRISQDLNENEKSGYVSIYNLKEYNRDKNWYNKYYAIHSIDSVPTQQYFFNASFLTWDDTSFVVTYKENVLSESPVFVARIGLNGQFIWKHNLKSIALFKTDKETSWPYEFFSYPNELIVKSQTTKNAIGIQTKNGKIEWEYIIPVKQ